MAKIKTQTRFEDRIEEQRHAEAAYYRVKNGNAQPGDSLTLADAGLDAEHLTREERDRLQSVASIAKRAGNSSDFAEATQAVTTTTPKVEALIKQLDPKIEAMKADLESMLSKRAEALADLEEKNTRLSTMETARKALRSPQHLPEFIRNEVASLRQSVDTTRPIRQQIIDKIDALTSDADRVSVCQDQGITPSQESYEFFVSVAQSNPNHQGHEFWKSRSYSFNTWQQYETFCRREINTLREELEGYTEAAKLATDHAVSGLLDFYTIAL